MNRLCTYYLGGFFKNALIAFISTQFVLHTVEDAGRIVGGLAIHPFVHAVACD